MLTSQSLRAALDAGFVPAAEFCLQTGSRPGTVATYIARGIPSILVGDAWRMVHLQRGREWMATHGGGRRGRPRKHPQGPA